MLVQTYYDENINRVIDSVVTAMSGYYKFHEFEIVDVQIPDVKNIILTIGFKDYFGRMDYFEMYLLHSEDEFKTTKKDFRFGQDEYNIDNRIGLLRFRTKRREGFVNLELIQTGSDYYRQGYGSMLMEHLKKVVKTNVLVNKDVQYDSIEGAFHPFAAKPFKDVAQFYVKHGCPMKRLLAKEIYISLLEDDFGEKE